MSLFFKDKEKFFLIQDSLKKFSEDFNFISKKKPILIELNGEAYFLILNLVTHAGNTRPDDQYRIQINASQWVAFKKYKNDGLKVASLGFFPETQTFSAWEPLYTLERTTVSTFTAYTSHKKLYEAMKNDDSIHEYPSPILSRNTRCINFTPEFLGVYLQNIEKLHTLSEAELIELSAKLTSTPAEPDPEKPGAKTQTVVVAKKQIEVTSVQYPRDPNFRKNVLAAYQDACCLCGIQLGIIEAAHIVPHCQPSSTDETSNGLALCPSHHKMFDSGLIYFDENFLMRISPSRLTYVKENGLIEGIDKAKELEGEKITLPEIEGDAPNPEFIKKGNKIRLFD